MSSEARQALLQQTRSWIGEHYEAGESEPVAWENAVRAAFGLPHEDDDVEIKISDFDPKQYHLASVIFRDIVRTAEGVHEGHIEETHDGQVCLGAWVSVKDAPNQKDLTAKQRKQAALTAMLDALQFYVTYIDGGLQQATGDINIAVLGDYDALLGGG